jgi:hypothetical protein
MKYEIQSRDYYGQWSIDTVGTENVFDTETEAWAAVEDLKQLGHEWAEADYRVEPIRSE